MTGNLIGRIAAEALEPQLQQEFDNLVKVAVQPFRIGSMLVVETRQIAPHHLTAILHAGWMSNITVFLHEPFAVLARQFGVEGTMVDHQVHHHLETQPVGGGQRSLDLLLGGKLGSRVHHQRIEFEVVGDGIEAARGTGLLDWIDENPVKTHVSGPFEVRFPVPKRPSQQGKKVIDQHRRLPKILHSDGRDTAARSGGLRWFGTTGHSVES